MTNALDLRKPGSEPKRRRRWLRYSLRGLFGLVLLAALGSWRTRAKLDEFAAEHEAIERLRKAGGRIQTVPAAPQWFWKLFPKSIARQCEHAFHADLHPMKRLATDADMAIVGRFTRLETLMVRGKLITDEGCSHCRGLTRLRVLWLQGSPSITSRGLECFLGAKGLEHLELGGASLGDSGMEIVARFPELKNLGLPGTQVGDSGLRRVTALKRLLCLRLPPTVTREGLSRLGELPSVCVLHIWINASDDGPVFDSVARLTKLAQLDISGDGLADADLAQIVKAPALERLDIRGGRISESGLLALKDAQKLRAVSVYDPWFKAGTQERLTRALAPISVDIYERPADDESLPRTREEFLQRAAREMEGRGGAAPERDERRGQAAGREPDDTRLAAPPRRRADGTRQRGPRRAPPRGAPGGSSGRGGGRWQRASPPGGARGRADAPRASEQVTPAERNGTRSQ